MELHNAVENVIRRHMEGEVVERSFVCVSLCVFVCVSFSLSLCHDLGFHLLSSSYLSSIIKKRTFSRAVFLRDPLERMLSGYIDKCVRPKSKVDYRHCLPSSAFNNNLTDPKHLRLGMQDRPDYLFAGFIDAFPLKWDVHFFPQSLYCGGLFRHIGGYDYVGIMGEGFYKELARMASTFDSEMLTDAIQTAFSLPKKGEWESKLVASQDVKFSNRTFSLLPKTRQAEWRHATNAPEFVQLFFTASSVRRALEYYAVDYVMLGLEVPGWVHDMLAEDPQP
jgi:hypothetical protein